jgi:hypothetical protein
MTAEACFPSWPRLAEGSQPFVGPRGPSRLEVKTAAEICQRVHSARSPGEPRPILVQASRWSIGSGSPTVESNYPHWGSLSRWNRVPTLGPLWDETCPLVA